MAAAEVSEASAPPAAPGRRPPQLPFLVWPALAAVYILWGSTYLGIRLTIETLPPLLTAATRFLLAAAILGVLAFAAGAWRRPPSRRQVLNCAVVGVALFAGGNGMVVLAEGRIPSGATSLFVAVSPLLVALMSFLFYGQRPGAWQVVGMGLGFVGLAVLVRPTGAAHLDPLGAGVALLSAVFWSAGSLYASRAPLPSTPLVAASLQMLFGGAGQALLGCLLGEAGRVHLQTASARSVGALLYLVVFGSLVAFTAYSWLVRAAPLSLVFTYVYVNPVIAVALGVAVLGERLTLAEAAGGLVILCGVAIIVTGQAAAGRRWQTSSR
jgi:drug/metabolite transporter (DMT)-like permease